MNSVKKAPTHMQVPLKVAIVVHVFYLDLWPEISLYLKTLAIDFALHITCCIEQEQQVRAIVLSSFPQAAVHPFPNQGMDVVPFLMLLPELKRDGYCLVCKLHTKRGVVPLGSVWRKHLLRSLVGCTVATKRLLKAFGEDPLLAVSGPADLYVSAKVLMYENRPLLEKLYGHLQPTSVMPDDWGFFAGSMLWARVGAILPVAIAANELLDSMVQPQNIQANADGEVHHALERALSWVLGNHHVGLISSVDSQVGLIKKEYSLKILDNRDLESHFQRLHVSQILRRLNKLT